MKIHEYQGKHLLKNFNIPIQDGLLLEHLEESEKIITQVQSEHNTTAVIVKAQIHAGGRGKGGGIKYCKNQVEAIDAIKTILNNNLITPQTDEQGQKVRKIFITQAIDIKEEYYLAITLDRSKQQDVIIASTEGGVDIEKVAQETPDKIIKEWIHPLIGIKNFNAQNVARNLGFTNQSILNEATQLIKMMYSCYKNTDASLVEINPLVLTTENHIIALDAKFNFDSNALYRQNEIAQLRDPFEENPFELEASKYGLNYIKLDGNVGCMVNGAGLAMATMDIIKLSGGEPANFLDVGGNASVETVKNGFKIILSDKNVKSILINIFGGIVRCDRVANGVVQAVTELELNIPVIVRLEGTNAKEAKKILEDSGLSIIPASNMKDAAIKSVESVNII